MRFQAFIVLLTALPLLANAAETRFNLNNGDQITAEVIKEDQQHYYLAHPLLGDLTIAKTDVVEVKEKESEVAVNDSDIKEKQLATAPIEKDTGLFGTSLLQNWKRRLDVGIAGSAGKSSNHQINIGFNADYEDDKARISHKTAYYRAESEGDVSDHSAFSLINKDWLSPNSPWIKFASGRVDIDEFKDWDYRLNADGGIGYEFINNERFLFVARTGLGFSQTFGGERETFTPEGSLGFETRWNISDYQQFKFANTYYPSLDELNEFRNISTLDWTLDLNTFAGMALKLGLLNEYDSSTDGDIDKNDFKYTISLAWTL